MESRNPAHPDAVVASIQCAAVADVANAAELALSSSADWRSRPAVERIAVMRRAAMLMRERRYELAAWEIVEVGKPWREADADVAEAIDFLEFYASQMSRFAARIWVHESKDSGRLDGGLESRIRPSGGSGVEGAWAVDVGACLFHSVSRRGDRSRGADERQLVLI